MVIPKKRLRVFLSVDTEAWPKKGRPARETISDAIDRDVFGRTSAGEFGIVRQMEILERSGLRAVFHVESLFASAVGLEHLQRIVAPVIARGHDVQLHVHTEWLSRMEVPLFPIPELDAKDAARGEARGQHIRHFDVATQKALLAEALKSLKEAGVKGIRAYRAGSFGASRATLDAVFALGLEFDSSFDHASSAGACQMRFDAPLVTPARVQGGVELPVSWFRDGLGRVRRVQLNGCTFSELKCVLESAHARGHSSLTILYHSFELLNSARSGPDPIVLKRFERLAEYLASESERFDVTTFEGVSSSDLVDGQDHEPVRTGAISALAQGATQLWRRMRS